MWNQTIHRINGPELALRTQLPEASGEIRALVGVVEELMAHGGHVVVSGNGGNGSISIVRVESVK